MKNKLMTILLTFTITCCVFFATAAQAGNWQDGFGPEDAGKEFLSLKNHNIKSIDEIKGLEHLVSLKWLYLQQNQITEIKNLVNLKNLIELNLNDNQITDYEGLKDLKNLKTLHLDGNSLTNEDFYNIINMPALRETIRELYFRNNKVEGVFDFTLLAHFVHPARLHLESNQITAVTGFESLPDVYSNVYLMWNRLPLSQLFALKKYDVGGGIKQYNVFFETLNLKTGEPLDLSAEAGFEGDAATFWGTDPNTSVGAVINKCIELDGPEVLRLNKTDFLVFSRGKDPNDPERPKRVWHKEGEVYTNNNGVITFLKPGRYYVSMRNFYLPQLTVRDEPTFADATTGVIIVTQD